jgi:hypothetical protein
MATNLAFQSIENMSCTQGLVNINSLWNHRVFDFKPWETTRDQFNLEEVEIFIWNKIIHTVPFCRRMNYNVL